MDRQINKISVIIPTLNEEKSLPRLLTCLKEQTFRDFEIIVSDAGSTDDTVNIAKQDGITVTKGGLPSVGRNAGAEETGVDFLFFLDADVEIPATFLANAYREMTDDFYDLATCKFKFQSTLLLDRVIFWLINFVIGAGRKVNPQSFGSCILVTRKLFERIGGFDETVILAEDCDFVKRASRYRPLEILKSTYFIMSARRFVKEGRLRFLLKGLHIFFYRLFRGEIRTNVIDYEFANFEKEGEKKVETPKDSDKTKTDV